MSFSNILVFFVIVSIVTLRNGCKSLTVNETRALRLETLHSSDEQCANSNFDCPGHEECREGICVNVCINNCLEPHETCYSLNNQARCTCEYGYAPNAYGICEPSCIESSDCGNLQECVVDELGLKQCQCQVTYTRDLYNRDKCELSKSCHNDNACQDFEQCIDNQCVPSCSKYDCTGQNEGCMTVKHKARCICNAGFARNPDGICEEECFDDNDCEENESCSVFGAGRFCNCIENHLYDPNGVCRKSCAYPTSCDPGFWCKLHICTPCDGGVC